MSSEITPARSSAVPVPRTAVPIGLDNPVEQARAELKAALAAIEDKANVPKRVVRASRRAKVDARSFARDQPVAAVAIVVAGAAAAGALVWWIVRSYTR